MGYDGDIVLKAVMDHTGIDDSLKSIKQSISKGFRNIIRYGLGVRSIFALINKLRRALVAGFGDLSQVSEPFNQAMSSIINALASLKASFSAAFAPIIQVVAPALVTFINLVGAAVDRIGMLIAALTGQKTYIKAIPVQVDYAKSLGDTSDNANKASKSLGKTNKQAKELKKTIAGFDDVEILHADNDDDSSSGGSGGSGGGGGGISGGGLQQALMPISKSVEDFAKKLKEAWEKADFTEIGRIIGEKLKTALESIPWGKINNVLQKVAKSVATGLNGFLETPGLFTTIGKTIANGINAAFGAAEAYITNFHYDSLGKAIHDLILGVVNNIDWSTIYNVVSGYATGIATTLNNVLDDSRVWNRIGYTISKALNAIINGLYDFITNAHFDVWATNLANALNMAILHHFSWVKLANTLIVLINKAFLAWKNFIETAKFDEWAKIIGKNLADVITGIDWETGVYDVTETINKLLKALTAFAKELPWKEIGQIAMDAVVQFFTEFSWLDAGTALNTLANGLLDAIQGAVEEIPWADIPEIITKAISDFLAGFKWEELFDKALGIFKTVIEDIKNALKGNDISEEDSPLISVLKSLQKLLDKIIEIDFSSIASGFKRIVKALSPAVKGFAEGLLTVLNTIIEAGIAFFEKLGPALDAIASALERLDPAVLEQIGNALSKIAIALGTLALAQGAKTVIGGVSDVLGPLVVKLGEAGLAGEVAAGGAEAVGEAAKNAGSGVGKFASGLATSAGATAAFQESVETNVIRYLDGSAKATEEADAGFRAISSAMFDAGEAGHVSGLKLSEIQTPMNHIAQTDAPDFATAFYGVAQNLENAGGDMDVFKTSLQEMLDKGKFTEEQAAVIQEYINGIGSSASSSATNTDTLSKSMEGLSETATTTDTNTSGVGAALKEFDGLSLATPIKLLLIQAAIKALGDKGKISKEETEKLQGVLDEYDPDKPEQSMGRIAKAFEDTGISATDFNTSLALAFATADTQTQEAIKQVLTNMSTLETGMQTSGETAGKNLPAGLAIGIADPNETKNVEEASTSLIEDSVLGTVDDAGDMHSPSKAMETRGKNLLLGLRNGMNAMTTSVKLVITTLMTSLKTNIQSQSTAFQNAGKGIVTNIKLGIINNKQETVTTMHQFAEDLKTAFTDINNVNWKQIGDDIAKDIYNGIKNSEYTLYKFAEIATSIASTIATQFGLQSWPDIGTNIGWGIYNGLNSMSYTLQTLAWNLALSMYNAACAALGIASPSKKFAWIGEMTMEGLGDGIEDNQKGAISAIDDMVDTMTKHAGNLQSVANAASLAVPSVAQGKVVPNSVAVSNTEDRLAGIMTSLEALSQNTVTRDELASLLQDVARAVSTEFYIGDEQIARHANAGNVRINRRYKTTWE